MESMAPVWLKTEFLESQGNTMKLVCMSFDEAKYLKVILIILSAALSYS